jgi:hypothetical protein
MVNMRSVLLLLFAFVVPLVAGQFGVNKEKPLAQAAVGENGEVDYKLHPVAIKLLEMADIGEEYATDIAALIDGIRADPETNVMIAMMIKDEGETLQALANDLSPKEVVVALKQTIDELKAIEYLFADPERAVVEMEKEGLLDKKKLSIYKKDPKLLEDDTRKGTYFAFVSLAIVGGFL